MKEHHIQYTYNNSLDLHFKNCGSTAIVKRVSLKKIIN
jgi:hypothetical protein